ncbi:glutathione S-transferase [Exophiala aquamarina CBS 119918]|uniref:Glutathione S-transferase n=1 Tax=Exophiala aquamarina CBS 119918 TaxID=1182545 RepID=A0A072PFV8_9EURO|nr:glutathione S-transferase [Exophiala aquamarina CBS 119918]KEF58647.1 glutathione S-transferase [Exophiala aquamarina CBS 119918]
MGEDKTITFYTAFSPNGHKIAITLEELGLPYEMVHVNLPAIQHKEPWFMKINPNGRIPALTDTLEDGTQINLFESGSIQQYLVDRYDTENKISYPRGTKEFYQTNNWLFFQNAGIGPMQGQANHFVRYCLSSEPEQYSKDRYVNETRRLYRTLNKHLQDSQSKYLVGDKCTIADIAISSWANITAFAGVDISEFPYVGGWQARMAQRPAVHKGSQTPKKVDLEKLEMDPEAFKTYLKTNEAWIKHGMDEDRKK